MFRKNNLFSMVSQTLDNKNEQNPRTQKGNIKHSEKKATPKATPRATSKKQNAPIKTPEVNFSLTEEQIMEYKSVFTGH